MSSYSTDATVAGNLTCRGSNISLGPASGTVGTLGGPFIFNYPWDAPSTSHTINIQAGLTGSFDNTAFMLYIWGRNTNASTASKSGLIILPCTKRYNFWLSQQFITALTSTSSNMTTWSWTIPANTNNVVVTTDSDVSVSYCMMGGC